MEQESRPLRKRSVVSSLIFWTPPGGTEKVALFRRSAKVNTYQHRWAPISGSIDSSDASPLAAAWRELSEETTLTPAKGLTLHHEGLPFTFTDAALGREWTVHPFAFRLGSPPGTGDQGPSPSELIKIDWEHESWAWFDPAEVSDSPSSSGGVDGENSRFVPRLTQTLKAVWLVRELGSAAAAEKVHSAVVRLREDHKSGARALAGIALDAFRDVLVELLPPLSSGTLAPGQEPEDAWLGRAKRVAWTLWKHGRPSMDSAIVHVLVAALRSVEELVQSGDRLGKGALDSIEALQSQRRGTARSISTQFIRYAQELVAIKASGEQGPVSNQRVMPQITILTLSSSGTILESLQTLAQALSSYPEQPKIIEIRVLESRPLFEGADMAAALLRHSRENGLTNLKVTVYPDAAIALAARGVDMLLLGADRIGETGEVSNKLGSLSAAIVTKDVCPTARVVVLSESEKIALPGRAEEHLVEENDPGEVIKSWSKETQATFTEELDEERRDIRRDTRAHVGVRNVYFEWIPAKLIDAYISENGELKVGDIKAHSISLLDSVSKLIPQHEG